VISAVRSAVMCLSTCLSLTSQVDVRLKRLNIESHKQHHMYLGAVQYKCGVEALALSFFNLLLRNVMVPFYRCYAGKTFRKKSKNSFFRM